MSTLKTANIQDTSGGNNSTPEQINQGRAKVWVSFNGTGTLAVGDSFGVSSVTDEGAGQYTINFTTAFANTNYAVAHGATFTTNNGFFHFYDNESTGSVAVRFISSAGAYADSAHVSCVVFGD